jgi:hypothetical protein
LPCLGGHHSTSDDCAFNTPLQLIGWSLVIDNGESISVPVDANASALQKASSQLLENGCKTLTMSSIANIVEPNGKVRESRD